MELENQEIETIENTEIETPAEVENKEPPAYEPSYRFKVGEQEHEFDDRLKTSGLIKSKEDEEYFRDLYTKAYGLDVVKSRHEEKKKEWETKESEFSQLKSTYDRVQNSLQKLNAMKGEDFGLFQKAWEIPNEAILERAKQILEVHGNPAAAAQAQKSLEDRWNLLQYEDRVNQETLAQSQIQRQLHDLKMTQAMTNPDISRFASEFDKKMGAGAFQEEVSRLGTLEFHAGRYLDPQVAVQQAHQRLSRLFTPEQPAPASAPATSERTPDPKPTLPNIGSGRTGTAVHPKPRSIADLRKLAQSME